MSSHAKSAYLAIGHHLLAKKQWIHLTVDAIPPPDRDANSPQYRKRSPPDRHCQEIHILRHTVPGNAKTHWPPIYPSDARHHWCNTHSRRRIRLLWEPGPVHRHRQHRGHVPHGVGQSGWRTRTPPECVFALQHRNNRSYPGLFGQQGLVCETHRGSEIYWWNLVQLLRSCRSMCSAANVRGAN